MEGVRFRLHTPKKKRTPFAMLAKGSFPNKLNPANFYAIVNFMDLAKGKSPRTRAELTAMFVVLQKIYPAGKNMISTAALSTYVTSEGQSWCACDNGMCGCNITCGCKNGSCGNNCW